MNIKNTMNKVNRLARSMLIMQEILNKEETLTQARIRDAQGVSKTTIFYLQSIVSDLIIENNIENLDDYECIKNLLEKVVLGNRVFGVTKSLSQNILDNGQSLIFQDKSISKDYLIEQTPEGKAYLITLDENYKNKTIRELTQDEYKLLPKYEYKV
ncbi:hypothetical protein CFT12S00416_07840 [Campylobacter fetus subsp. testudinum]|uniref:hypothetical protein n=1 Tax=Campylobacter fetus TaxID=196 RepID=UPI000818B771|nr:hypothetical protein [Campylobacter fetus]OCR87730.1 hypothetical protein CFT12S00416_07840 [Campylobacter fetus subsp. testudinum]